MKIEDHIKGKDDLTSYENSRNLFHLKTLYDVSRVLLDQGDVDKILRNFLLMTMGSFGVTKGFVYMNEDRSLLPQKLTIVGFDDKISTAIEKGCHKLLLAYDRVPAIEHVSETRHLHYFSSFVSYVSVFNIAYACNGILGLGPKLTDEPYTSEDTELFETLVIHLAGTLKNVRSTEALKSAFREVSSINQAKTKVINHLSHELKTPISLLTTSHTLLRKHLDKLPGDEWIRTYDRAGRSLKRMAEIQRATEDIMKEKVFEQHRVASALLNECTEILKSFTAEQLGEGPVVEKIQRRIDEVYRPVEQIDTTIVLGDYVKDTLAYCRGQSRHRHIDIRPQLESTTRITMPKRIISIILVGIIKNAIENTPDEGRIDLLVKDTPLGVHFSVHDFGTGVVTSDCEQIFGGFYPTQETDRYATKQPYDFNAGGKGTDLLRIKIFSESYGFKVYMTSARCTHIPTTQDTCPGSITLCKHCKTPEDCYSSGTTTVTVDFSCSQSG